MSEIAADGIRWTKATHFIRLAIFLGIGFCLGCSGSVQNTPQAKNDGQPIADSSEVWLPSTIEVPQGMKQSDFQLRPLVLNDVRADYEAVMESKLQLRELFGGEWPQDDFTLEQNLDDLKVHEQAFQDREAFAYTVTSPGQARVLGCVYIHPADDADAQVIFWVRTSELAKGTEKKLFESLKVWLTTEWPFSNVSFPGRE
ncbi:GNAT family N-acetyltransferase [bacterium]|nr:GNAT family N-acetyltransferase [bacterium]